jgi:hypothetical protein
VGDGWWADCGRQGWRNVVIGTRESCGKKRRIYSDGLARAMASASNALHRNPYAKEGRRRQPTTPVLHIPTPFNCAEANSIAPHRYTIPKNYHGLTLNQAAKYGVLAAGFGGVAGFFALFFFAEVPKVRDDIMKKIPVLDKFFTNEIPPEDNPF